MDFSKFKGKVKQVAAQRKEKLLRGDYQVQSRTRKVISYATAVGKNVADDITPSKRTSSQLFPFGPSIQQRSSKRRHHEEKRRKHHRSKRRPQREPYNPYPLI